MQHHQKRNNLIIVGSILFVCIVAVIIISRPSIGEYFNSIRSSGVAGPGGSGKGNITVTCLPPVGYPGQPAYVNKQVLWRVTVDSPSQPVNSLWYVPSYDNVLAPSVKIKNESFEVAKTYTTIGKKRFKVSVDQGSSVLAECPETELLVKVAPRVNNR